MNIPSHRAAAVAPTPAHSFELRDGELVNRTEEERTPAEPAGAAPPAPSKGSRTAAVVPTAPAASAE